MSLGLIRLKKLLLLPLIPPISRGTPSRTINGSLLAFKEAPPRIRMVLPAVGEPLLDMICTPAILPLMSCSGELIIPSLKSLLLTLATAPVRSPFREVPYPMTTTSSSVIVCGFICNRMLLFAGMGIFTVSYPMKENCSSLFPAGTLRVKFPSKSVVPPEVVPTIRMATPGIGCLFSSSTLPVTVLLACWAKTGYVLQRLYRHSIRHIAAVRSDKVLLCMFLCIRLCI